MMSPYSDTRTVLNHPSQQKVTSTQGMYSKTCEVGHTFTEPANSYIIHGYYLQLGHLYVLLLGQSSSFSGMLYV